MLLDPLVANPANFRLLVELSLRHQVPLLAPAAPFVEAGALVSVGPDYFQAGRRAAEIAQRVAAGQGRPGDFAERAPDFVVTINGRVARQFGIAIPADLRADILSPQDAP
jgi:putative ABC transport system substrate-binding protein